MEKEGHCFICRERISNWAEAETFKEEGKSITVHKRCVPVFRSFVQRAIGSDIPPETRLLRSPSLIEFIRDKKPKTEDEKLACVAYFLEKQAGQPLELAVKDVKEHIESADLKISDISTAFIRARNRKGFFERVPGGGRPIRHRLTKTGADLVEKLPERPE